METKILSINWYIEPPIDFEHKQYILFAHLQKVDNCFFNKILSPYFLNLENVLYELKKFDNDFIDLKQKIKKNEYIYFDNPYTYDGSIFDEIKEIVDFSIPQIESRLLIGKKILEKNNQLIF